MQSKIVNQTRRSCQFLVGECLQKYYPSYFYYQIYITLVCIFYNDKVNLTKISDYKKLSISSPVFTFHYPLPPQKTLSKRKIF